MARSRRKSAADIDFSNFDEAREWFRRQPREVSVTLAIRSALRVLPLIETSRKSPYAAPHLALPVFRACFVAWVIAKSPSQHNHLRRAAAVAAGATPVTADYASHAAATAS